VKIVKNVQPPTGVRRFLFRAPIYLDKAGLGWMLGHRIMLLRHVGRMSGIQRQAVLEVVEHDRTDDSFVVASGWGPTAAWYQDVVHDLEVIIQVGRRTIPVTAVKLNEDEGADLFARYVVRHRMLRMLAMYLLPRLMGFSVDGSVADFREAGRHMPFIRFVPRS
jgi:deazaflavin-dependent oxidoreductase (nitroreductase family)